MMVLAEAVKESKVALAVMPTLVLYGEDGGYTDEINRIYFG
jgi:tRNA1(Val) A37 N6-methylase TrmN6